MTIPVALAARLALDLVRGPLMKVIDGHVADAALRRTLAAELERQALAHLAAADALGQGVVMAEIQSEHWLTRSWRPLLMLVLMGFLVLAGLVLPLAELVAGRRLPFEPRWQLLPAGFWEFLSIGMGGYIGGRSLEKAAGLLTGKGRGRDV